MASLRTGYGLPARPTDGPRPRMRELPGSSGSIPRTSSRLPRQESEPSRIPTHGFSQPKPQSRVPQPSTRLPSTQSESSRHVIDRQAQVGTSKSRMGTSAERSHVQIGSGSSTSSRSNESGLSADRTMLRRRKSSVSRNSPRDTAQRTDLSSSIPRSGPLLEPSPNIQYGRGSMDDSSEIRVAQAVEIGKANGGSPVIYPELDRYRDYRQPLTSSHAKSGDIPYRLATHDLPPPTPGSLIFSGSSSQVSAMSASPSAKWSESPGPGPGTYSRDTTPTSMSSQSPSLVATSRLMPMKSRQNSPAQTRPPVSRLRAGSIPKETDLTSPDPHGLAAVRESLNSSSSNSTVRDGDKNARKGKKVAKKMPPPPPSPPPRKSSQKFEKKEKDKDVKPSTAPVMPAPPQRKISMSPQKSGPASRASPLPSPTSIPSRPSREGTPNIQSQLFGPPPIIHSNLSSNSLPYERRGSESAVSSSLPRPGVIPGQSTKNASTSNLPTEKDLAKASKKDKSGAEKRLAVPEPSRAPTRTPSPSVSSSFNSRFNFFGRKKNNVTDNDQTEKKQKGEKKSSRKGPVAGTGHEGYGRLGNVRRRSGSASNGRGHGPQSSQESLASNDAFLAERMNPVVILGGEIVSNRNPSSELNRTESNQSIANSLPSVQSKISSDMSASQAEEARAGLWLAGNRRAIPSSRRPSDSSDSDGAAMKSTLAFRRSMQRLRYSPDHPLRLPKPINTSGSVSSPMTSFDTSVMSDDSFVEMQQDMRRGRDAAHPAPKKLTKRPRSPRKWNLFGKSHSQAEQKKDEQVAATITAVEKKPMAFYTMMDASEQEDGETPDIQEVLRSANVYGDLPNVSGNLDMGRPATRDIQSSQLDHSAPSVALDHGVSSTSLPPSQSHAAPSSGTMANPSRPSRLAQVGRIPKVVSNRVEHSSPVSFSRPFRSSMQPPARPVEVPDPEGRPSTSSRSGAPVPDLINDGSVSGSGTNFSSSHESTAEVSPETRNHEREFLVFSPRKDSEGTIGTSSSSSGNNPFAVSTAVIPNADDPPAEDEVWDEFDDLIGEDHLKQPPSATSSKGTPFHLETYHSRLVQDNDKSLESPTMPKDIRQLSMLSKATTRSSAYSADMTERIRTAFQPHHSPTTTFPIPEHPPPSLRGRRSQSLDLGKPKPQPSRRNSSASCRARDSDYSTSSSEDGSPLSQVNLRVGSMTVSKWLTFGHVLFSDVRHELIPVEGSLKRHSILVIDGLGNDDWSFYAAETYPAATFFNLSPRAPLPAELQTSPTSFPLSPPNHHQVQYLSHLEKFPFAPQSFTSVVYRFPVAASESSYRNILSEARRVLKPGGYIELSILDVDLNNMGNRGRRAIRDLKERIHEQAPDTNLASTADLIVRLLGKAGFSNIKAARVGVPVASSIARRSSGHKKDKTSEGDAAKKKDKPSLSEMMNDNSPVADKSITKMVTRVGRWWYTRCYESATGYPGDNSMWNNRRLLAECEERGTSLKLMVCCARAPERITSY